ncbi:translation elongation factor alpha [Reticulomyxa filosa]|uniref:Translation elongation factor alpha n=1 Tax=Reticulomyxa filosa TaxID=46433 RepID=X6NVS3_RETFI|nr:translation elongation factor alpha [Reticulomyxa filosa]|eukprot:ETO29988.1 translation elongation factor alpha [Reticulomyxa filosa]
MVNKIRSRITKTLHLKHVEKGIPIIPIKILPNCVNIVQTDDGKHFPWYNGFELDLHSSYGFSDCKLVQGKTIIDALSVLSSMATQYRHNRVINHSFHMQIRITVKRIVVGCVDYGSVKIGDTVRTLPRRGDLLGKSFKVVSIQKGHKDIDKAQAGDLIGIKLDPYFAHKNGDILVSEGTQTNSCQVLYLYLYLYEVEFIWSKIFMTRPRNGRMVHGGVMPRIDHFLTVKQVNKPEDKRFFPVIGFVRDFLPKEIVVIICEYYIIVENTTKSSRLYTPSITMNGMRASCVLNGIEYTTSPGDVNKDFEAKGIRSRDEALVIFKPQKPMFLCSYNDRPQYSNIIGFDGTDGFAFSGVVQHVLFKK